MHDQGQGVKRILNKFAGDYKLDDTVDPQEGRKILQRDLDMLHQWTEANCIRFNKKKCWVQPLGHKSPLHLYSFGAEWLESCLGEGTCVCWLTAVEHELRLHHNCWDSSQAELGFLLDKNHTVHTE